jgi:L-lactate dehydrogenase complex protein LldE
MKMEVDIFIPCYIDQIYPQTGINMVKILEKAGCKVHYNPNQTCCGQPAFNAGFWDECKEVGEKFIKEFADNKRYIVTPSASCAAMVKTYYSKMFHNTVLHNEYKEVKSNIIELSDFLVNVLKFTDFGAKFDATVTYHDSCAALREYGIKEEPRILLRKVKGLTLKEMKDTETCCGFGGLFAVKFEPISAGMADQKMGHANDTGADYLVSTDSSCLLHLGSYADKQKMTMKTLHLADVLASGW